MGLKNSGIYKIVNLVNNKIYIGSSVNLCKRKSAHFSYLKNNSHPNNRLQNAYNKYGFECFSFIVLEYYDDKKTLIDREQHYLDLHQCYLEDVGYNIVPKAGAKPERKVPAGRKHTDEFKKRMSEARRGSKNPFFGKSHTEENLKSMSLKNSGEGNAFFGKTHSLEVRQKSSLIHKGKVFSLELRKKLSSAGKGRKQSDAHIQKRIAARLLSLKKAG